MDYVQSDQLSEGKGAVSSVFFGYDELCAIEHSRNYSHLA